MPGTKQHSGGRRPNAGRKPLCGLCRESVTKSQLALGDAYRLSDGNTYHADCLQSEWDDLRSLAENERFEKNHPVEQPTR